MDYLRWEIFLSRRWKFHFLRETCCLISLRLKWIILLFETVNSTVHMDQDDKPFIYKSKIQSWSSNWKQRLSSEITGLRYNLSETRKLLWFSRLQGVYKKNIFVVNKSISGDDFSHNEWKASVKLVFSQHPSTANLVMQFQMETKKNS